MVMVSAVAGACTGRLHARGGDGKVVAAIVLRWFELKI